MKKYAKLALTVVATVVSAIVAVSGGGISPTEWVNVAVAAVTAAGVFAAPNVPGAVYTKSILAVLGAVLMVLTSAIVGGITGTEWLQIALAALGALGVYAVPNMDGDVNLSYTGGVGLS